MILRPLSSLCAHSRGLRHYLTGRMFRRRKDKWTQTRAPNKPYYLGLSESLNDIGASVKRPGLGVDLVCDQQHEYADHALNMFKWNKDHVRHLSKVLGEISFKDKSSVGGLQAADMLAHSCYRRVRKNVGESDELDSVTIRLRPLAHKRVRIIDKDQLRRRLDRVPPEVARALKWKAK